MDALPTNLVIDTVVMAEYISLWAAEPAWPACKVDVVTLVYDILKLTQFTETEIADLLGEPAVSHLIAILNTILLPTAASLVDTGQLTDDVPW